MTLHTVALAGVPPQPWRNGGGSTRELLAWPPGAPPSAWQLRVSVATIAQDGPFSAYPGMRRWLAVLRGASVVLALRSGKVQCTAGGDALTFDGADAPGCTLVDGATDALNLMCAASAGQARLWRAHPGDPLRAGSRWRGVVACHALLLDTPAGAVHVPDGTLLWSDDAQAGAWHLPAASQAWCMELRA